MSSECNNCGAPEGVHQYETNQCPVGGYEVTTGKQSYAQTVYLRQNDITSDLVKRIEYTAQQMKNAAGIIRSGRMELILQVADDLERQAHSNSRFLEKEFGG